MKKFFTVFFVVLGVIFFVIILFGVWFYVTDPLNLKPLFFNADSETVSAASEEGEVVDLHPFMNEAQETALENLGIDPSALPHELTPEQAACFEEKLGSERVAEIVNGGQPSVTEIVAAAGCL
jgi:hypothetical protein